MDLEVIWLEYQDTKNNAMPLKSEQYCFDQFEKIIITARRYKKALEKISMFHPIEVRKGELEYDRMVRFFQTIAKDALE